MDKDTKETICAVITLIAVVVTGYAVVITVGYDRGLSDGVTLTEGDKLDCGYSRATGFIMCDRTPKYK